MRRGTIIANADGISGKPQDALLSLIFAKGHRPTVDALRIPGDSSAGLVKFAISHAPDPGQGWVELLALGLTFDCTGLSPAAPAPVPARGALLGLETMPDGEAVSLQPGPHLSEGRGLLPVVRVLAGMGVALATLPGVVAVCWPPAGSWMEPGYFRRIVGDWFAGGAFPALGLTSLQRESNGAMVSVGLGLLIGQELRFEPERSLSASAAARISVRLINELILHGPVDSAAEFEGPDGERLLAVPVREGQQLRVMIRK